MDNGLNNPHIISEEQLNAENSNNDNNNNNDNYNADNYNSNNYNGDENKYSCTENKKQLEEDNQNANIGIDTNTDIYNSVPNLKNKNNKYTFFRSFKGIIILTGIIIGIFIMFKFLYLNSLNNRSQKYNDMTGNRIKPINKYKNKIINYKKRFHPNIFNYTSSDKNNNLKTANQRKFSKKFYSEMQLLKKLKNYKNTGDNNNIDKNNLKNAKKNLLPINKKIVVFIKQSYAMSILKNEKEANKIANKNNIKLDNLKYYKKAANKKISTAVIPIGTVVNAYIKYKIFSYNTEVPVIAILSNTYYYKKKSFLKKGDKFFGMVSVKHSLDRLNIHFNRIIKTNGLSLGINAIAMMPNGSGGVKGNVHRHYKANILTSLAQGVVGAAALFAGGGSAANASNPYTFQNQIRQNVAQNELGQAQNGLNSIASSTQQATITLPKGTPIKIIFLRSVNIK
ncbi:MAG: hypothetical protein EVG15_07775 [Candidatus Acididesulfobacter diazotrophicus]|uniref:TrbI/VirB10 family protein n=1 Tax=Candidatus Acididesulfobacter diazotrophicus TaxID=2597226 RepID=A0A519BLH4_9DELT|nr:MAG: hypothetical protein EVG15_07775 [Candidatus Acididesulfobacter diazotrophicus]